MARRTRSASLETRTSRLKLAVNKKPYSAQIAPRIASPIVATKAPVCGRSEHPLV